MDDEIKSLQTLISDKEFKNFKTFETAFVESNSSVEKLAASLATYNMLQGDTNRTIRSTEVKKIKEWQMIISILNKD